MGYKSQNRIKQALRNGKTVLGTIVTTATPSIVEVLGSAGLDFVMIDTEHAPLVAESIEDMVRAAEVSNITPLVRVRDNDASLILRCLDIGAMGVHVPGVSTAEAAQKAVRAVKYWPLGERGLSPSHRAAGYGQIPLPEYMDWSNQNTMLVIHVEDKEGLDNIDEILDVSEIDVAFIGVMDLSQHFGVPGQTDHPIVQEAIVKILRAATKKNIAVGSAVGNIEQALELKRRGFRYIILSTALRLLWSIANDARRQIAEAGD